MIKGKGAIFDLDGTLLDTMPAWDRLGLNFLNRHGLLPTENLREELKPLGFGETGQYFKNKYNLPQSAEEISAEFLAMIEEQYHFLAPLKPHAKEFLTQLKEKGIKMCIATATHHALAEAALKRLEVLDYFAFVITCDEVGKGKDFPDIYLSAAKKLDLDPKEVTVFEDALHCIQTAKKAGFEVVGVYDESAKSVQKEIAAICDTYLYSYQIGGI